MKYQLGCSRQSVDRRVKLRYNCCAISLPFNQPPEFDGESDLTTTTGSTLIYNKILFMCQWDGEYFMVSNFRLRNFPFIEQYRTNTKF